MGKSLCSYTQGTCCLNRQKAVTLSPGLAQAFAKAPPAAPDRGASGTYAASCGLDQTRTQLPLLRPCVFATTGTNKEQVLTGVFRAKKCQAAATALCGKGKARMQRQ
jgi:hypothetical protein